MRLAVIDPALGTAQGHHSAFADLLRQAPLWGLVTSLWCHKKLSDDATQVLNKSGIEVHRSFAINWYQWSEQTPSVKERHSYLAQLVQQFSEVLLAIAAKGPSTLLYHSLDWIHGLALNLALERLGQQVASLQHLLLLMFIPGHDRPVITNSRQELGELNYGLGFRQLLARNNVTAYCSCIEHQHWYLSQFNPSSRSPNSFALFPCFLADWCSLPQPSGDVWQPGQTLNARCGLAFAGDPRPDKGFLVLPQLLEQLLAAKPDLNWVVQHTPLPHWASPEVVATANTLIAMSHNEPRIKLLVTHWSETELHRQMDTVDLVVLNYNRARFATKTSGFLWIAAWYRKPIITHANTWLWREAVRLGCQTHTLKQFMAADTPHCRPSKEEPINAVQRAQTYAPFLPWLRDSIAAASNSSDPQRADTTRHPADQPEIWTF